MVIVFCLDNNFTQHLFVSLESLIYHTKNTQSLKIYVIDGGINEQSKSDLYNHFLKKRIALNFLHADNSIFSGFIVDRHISTATYYRIAIADILPDVETKVIYLDCDVMVNHDLAELWDFDMHNYSIAAVAEHDNSRNIEMGLGETKTFNCGVLLMNIAKWRKEKIAEKVLNYIREKPEKIKFWDQDALNAVLLKDWIELPLKWNVTTAYFNKLKQLNLLEIKQVKNPYIIHYNTSIKPWHYISRHPYKKLYYKFLKLTPFKNYQPADKTLLNFIKKVISISLIKLKLKTLF
jgi:lipopolysaccharide biosynthesis glycosyltransferase